MSLSAATVWEVQPAGTHADDANGGGFVAGAAGTDYTQGAGLTHIDIADLETDGATLTVMVSVGRNFVAADVGNTIHVISGTHATAGWYRIVSVASNKATVDRAWATENNSDHNDGVAILGGALATPGGLGAVLAAHGAAGMSAWIKGGTTYTLANSTVNASGGLFSTNEGAMLNGVFTLSGYTTTRGDGGQITIDTGAQTGVTVININASTSSPQVAKNIIVDGNDGASTIGFVAEYAFFYNCVAIDCPTGFSSGAAINCKASGCTIGFTTYYSVINCWAHDCTTGFSSSTTTSNVVRCLATACGIGFSTGNGHSQVYSNCIAYGCSGDGFEVGGSYSSTLFSCFSGGSTGGYGYDASVHDRVLNCAAWNNASGTRDLTPNLDVGFVTIEGTDPDEIFIDVDTYDFRPTSVASRGALLRAAGFQPYWQSTSNLDIGAVQHADPVGGGGTTVPQGIHSIELGITA